MSLEQIRYFVAVAEEGNVGRASRRLRVAQPPLSRHMKSLEDELGAPLFARTSRGMRLLPPGEVFLAHAKKILAAVDEAREATAREIASDGSRSSV
jgi:DNA-binding transcriptional LysR family regulator